jgi:hypothetical protein
VGGGRPVRRGAAITVLPFGRVGVGARAHADADFPFPARQYWDLSRALVGWWNAARNFPFRLISFPCERKPKGHQPSGVRRSSGSRRRVDRVFFTHRWVFTAAQRYGGMPRYTAVYR